MNNHTMGYIKEELDWKQVAERYQEIISDIRGKEIMLKWNISKKSIFIRYCKSWFHWDCQIVTKTRLLIKSEKKMEPSNRKRNTE
jgi:hypothetical protein